MRIVSQSAPASYSQFPAPQLLMLCAPKIAGLLPATTSKPRPPVVSRPPNRVFRSFAEWEAADAELEAFFEDARRQWAALVAEHEYDAHLRSLKANPLVVCHD